MRITAIPSSGAFLVLTATLLKNRGQDKPVPLCVINVICASKAMPVPKKRMLKQYLCSKEYHIRYYCC